jgi:hypothetical protein
MKRFGGIVLPIITLVAAVGLDRLAGLTRDRESGTDTGAVTPEQMPLVPEITLPSESPNEASGREPTSCQSELRLGLRP